MKTSAHLAESDLSPTVLFCHLFPDDYGMTLDGFPELPLRKTYDYELEIYLTDGGSMLLGDKILDLQRGSVIFRRPGERTQALNPYRCYSVIVDLAGQSNKSRENYIHKAPQEIQTNYHNSVLDSIQPLTNSYESERLLTLFEKIYREFKANWRHTPIILRAYVLEIIYILYTHTLSDSSAIPSGSIQYHKSVRKSLDYIGANYNKKLLLSDIADYVGLSPNYFSRLFVDCMGQNLSVYIMNLRLQKAKELIMYTNLPVGDIAYHCGFESPAYFISSFHQYYGITPGIYRKKYT